MSYIGIPPFGQTIRSVTNITATASQTTFNIVGGYQIGYVDVYLNGVLLVPTTDYTATDGLTVVLGTGASSGDSFQALSYQPVSLIDCYTEAQVDALLATKQNTLVSGSNIKTVNSTTLLGSGDLAVQPTLVSGSNIKTVNSTSLLGSGDVAVQATLVSGSNIKTINSTSLLGSGDIAITSSPAGSNTYVQYNNSGSFGGSANFVFNGTNVGIGTSSPNNSLTVSRNGADVARFVNSGSNGGDWQLKIGGGGFEDRKLMITDRYSGADNVRMAIDSSGNVIVGATSNTYGGQFGLFSSTNTRLDIATTSSTAQQILSFGQNGTAKWQIISDLPASGSGKLDFVKPGTGSQMTIDSSGNVGIGTSSPGTKLSLQLSSATTYTTSTRTNQGLTIYNSSATTDGFTGIEFNGEPTSGNGGFAGIGSVVTGSGSANLVFGTRDSGTYAERFRIGPSGQLGIGGANYGSSGQALVSNGSGSAPSWQTVGSSTTLNDVGTYIFGAYQSNGGSSRGPGSTYSAGTGRNLVRLGYVYQNSEGIATFGTTTGTISGTWRQMAGAFNGGNNDDFWYGVFVRVS